MLNERSRLRWILDKIFLDYSLVTVATSSMIGMYSPAIGAILVALCVAYVTLMVG